MYTRNKVANLEILLNESLESYYWIGFLLADGHFEKARLKLNLADKDMDHLFKFCSYVSYTGSLKWGFASMNSDAISQLRNKFNIHNNKTYNPSSLTDINNDDKLLSLIIGFIDGDGSIKKQYKRNDCSLTIKLHSSWLDNLKFIETFLSEKFVNKKETAKINNAGYSVVSFTDSIILRELKKFTIEKSLPVLQRKWDLIDLNFMSKQEIGNDRITKVKEMLNENFKIKDIAIKLNMSYIGVYMIIKRNKL